MTVLLAFAAASLFGVGTYLVLQRQLSRIVIGIGLLGHGTNVLFVISARGGGEPPFSGSGDRRDFTDPLPQALALTAIVITFGVTAFLLALASHRSHHDEAGMNAHTNGELDVPLSHKTGIEIPHRLYHP